jgi:hypothetical protein
MNKEAIKSIVSLPAWEEVEAVLRDEFLDGKKPLNLKTEGKTAEMIAMEVMAREMSAKALDKALKRLRRIANREEYTKESFK